jgi:hypothetical protein
MKKDYNYVITDSPPLSIIQQWKSKDTRNQQENNIVFSMVLDNIQQRTTNEWCIPMEVV